MRLHHEGLELWHVVETENAPRKKDRQVMSIIFSTISDEITRELEVEKSARETWQILKVKGGGVSRLLKGRVQALRRDLKNLSMDDGEVILDFFVKISSIVVELRSLGENISESVVCAKVLRSVSGKFDSITTSIEQFQDLTAISLDDVVGTLKLHEDKLKEQARGKEKALDSESSRGRGRGRNGRGRGRRRGRGPPKQGGYEADFKPPRDKSKVRCYNCQGMGHYSNECRNPKKERPKSEGVDQANVIKEEPAEISLLMAHEEGKIEVLIQGILQTDLQKGMWYLDTGTSSHMTGLKSLFYELDEAYNGKVRFGDDSKINIEGKGRILLNAHDGTTISLSNMLYTPSL
ncbi:unnamed protein product [Spirodela intermedia]|uniref:CCHC-type domain-containing protein n=2 Tax=Spirodela intermedia TaxID=51605 RepID=A0A7I8JZG8_SPIIN|nr:unnamed protein product [Spirodela intermedia]CAA6654616.1 unnamed protein product [Spirodela intermedia]CAA7389252.1 unnamed protein product [Spirodela intermedia]